MQVNPDELIFTAIRAQGPGGQNVNKVSCAVHLRFDIAASSLSDGIKERLLARRDHRITGHGVVVIKAQSYRSQDKNREEALRRLQAMVDAAEPSPVVRRLTRPGRSARERRLSLKAQRSALKNLRGRIEPRN